MNILLSESPPGIGLPTEKKSNIYWNTYTFIVQCKINLLTNMTA